MQLTTERDFKFLLSTVNPPNDRVNLSIQFRERVVVQSLIKSLRPQSFSSQKSEQSVENDAPDLFLRGNSDVPYLLSNSTRNMMESFKSTRKHGISHRKPQTSKSAVDFHSKLSLSEIYAMNDMDYTSANLLDTFKKYPEDRKLKISVPPKEIVENIERFCLKKKEKYKLPLIPSTFTPDILPKDT